MAVPLLAGIPVDVPGPHSARIAGHGPEPPKREPYGSGARNAVHHRPDGSGTGLGAAPL
ncbi:hypothetical protein [Streptomyces sp. NPDC006134]|uniref:hypothetical protein n=1 Tax=Streptomyces sp. NPDC006134 TaxID=3154467 RepID=UPI003406A012